MPGGTLRGRCLEEELAHELAVLCPQPHLPGARLGCKGWSFKMCPGESFKMCCPG